MSPAHRARRGPGRAVTACALLAVVLVAGAGLLLRPFGGPVRTAGDEGTGTHRPSATPTASASGGQRSSGTRAATTAPTAASGSRVPARSSSAPALPTRVPVTLTAVPAPTLPVPRPSVTSHTPRRTPSPSQ